jgi:putative SOS response-associated peptidase YedK
MCGRFVLKTPAGALKRQFGFVELPNIRPRWNVAPTDESPVVRRRRDPPERSVALLRWGLVPPSAKDLKGGARCINARAETVLEKGIFRKPFERRRCLVPADGFYEWRKDGKARIPFLISRRDGAPLALAGIWDRWWPDRDKRDEHVDTFSIITTAANRLVGTLHDRMPVVLEPADWEAWLDPDADPERLRRALLRPAREATLQLVEVDPRVNSVRNDDAGLIVPRAEPVVMADA